MSALLRLNPSCRSMINERGESQFLQFAIDWEQQILSADLDGKAGMTVIGDFHGEPNFKVEFYIFRNCKKAKTAPIFLVT
jgi:hypothetical protein